MDKSAVPSLHWMLIVAVLGFGFVVYQTEGSFPRFDFSRNSQTLALVWITPRGSVAWIEPR